MIHTPVLINELQDLFQPELDNLSNRLLDATLGTGGHTLAYLTVAGPKAKIVGLDADPHALAIAKEQLKQFGDRVTYLNANFANLNDALIGGGIVKPLLFSHILFDLGLGSHQLADPERGFSFRGSSNLSMRYGQLDNLPLSNIEAINQLTWYLGYYPDASELIKELAVSDLAEVLRVYGEERLSARIAKKVHQAGPRTAEQLAQVVQQAVPENYEHGRIHPATRTFQALRLAVNRELEALEQTLPQAVQSLARSGRIAVISFHSLEDRIVKHFFRASDLTVLTKKPIRADLEEINKNPRARSAKLRIAQKP